MTSHRTQRLKEEVLGQYNSLGVVYYCPHTVPSVFLIQCTPDIVTMVIVATFPGTKYIYSIIFRSDIVANRIYSVVARKGWPKVATISEVHCNYQQFYFISAIILYALSYLI